MATLKLVLVNEHANQDGKYPIKLRFSANSKRADVNLNVFVSEENWHEKEMTILSTEPKFKVKNKLIQDEFEKGEEFMKNLSNKGRLVNDAKALRDLFTQKEKSIMFMDRLYEFAQTKTGKTKETYLGTWNKLKTYTDKDIYFDDITPSWLAKFEAHCIKEGNKVNTRGIHFRNMRKIFNDAIDDRVISADIYPFRRFKIKKEETDKRALTIEEFKKVMAYKGIKQEEWARDVFMLSFYLMGINMKDLFYLTEIDNGYINFKRFKSGRLYNIKVEPEAMELIEKYKGETLLLNFSDTIVHDENFRKKVNDYLATIAKDLEIRHFTTYSARHSWGTYAGELDIPKSTISHALGHAAETQSTTDIYIKFNHKKVEKANRDVIDFVNE